ncbi:MAG TPA: hypothetical protein VIS96_18175 [Terrimicrobiaceae bacterium]
MNNDLPVEPVTLWTSVEKRLAQGSSDTLPNWKFTPNLDIPRRQAEEEWLAFCWRDKDKIDTYCRAWIESSLSKLDDSKHLYKLCARLFIAHELVSKFSYVKQSKWTSPFPFIAGTIDEALSILLIDWWHGIGQFWAFDMVYNGKLLHDIDLAEQA